MDLDNYNSEYLKSLYPNVRDRVQALCSGTQARLIATIIQCGAGRYYRYVFDYFEILLMDLRSMSCYGNGLSLIAGDMNTSSASLNISAIHATVL